MDRLAASVRLLLDSLLKHAQQAEQAEAQLDTLGDGAVMRRVKEAMCAEVARARQIAERVDQLARSLRIASSLFEETERGLVDGVLRLAEDMTAAIASASPVAGGIHAGQFLLGDSRFQNAIYPDWLSEIARGFYMKQARA